MSTSGEGGNSRLTIVNCESAPQAIGPYNHAVKHANVVYTSGQIGKSNNHQRNTTKLFTVFITQV